MVLETKKKSCENALSISSKDKRMKKPSYLDGASLNARTVGMKEKVTQSIQAENTRIFYGKTSSSPKI